MRTGGQSGAGSSSERMAGIQYWRMRLPMGVPGPTLQSSSLSLALSKLVTSPNLLARLLIQAPLVFDYDPSWVKRGLPKLSPKSLTGDCGAITHGAELRPLDGRVRDALQTAVRARDHVLLAHDARVALQTLRHELRVLHELSRAVAQDARHEDLAVRKRVVLEDDPLVLVLRVCGLDGVALRLHFVNDVDDVTKR